MSGAVAVCWNCRAPLGEGPQCQTCGARRDPAVRPPAGASGEGRRRAVPGALGPQLRGRAAGVGRRLAAFTCDAALVLAVLVAAAVTTRSPVLVAVLGLEATLALALWEARTGLTVGNALLRLRTSRDDGPMSPGVGRQAARGAVLALGVLAGTVGAWVVVASSAWDPTGRRRSWADRAAGTVVVAVDRRERPAPATVPLVAPGLSAASGPFTGVMAGVPVPSVAPAPGAAPAAVTGPPPVAPAHQAAPGPVPAPPARPRQAGPAAVADSALLLVFDTGQREYLPLGAVAVLGRGPAPAMPTDLTITVHDDEGTVSKNHLRLEHARDGVWLTDLGSTNGTEVLADDGTTAALPAATRLALPEGARVRLGRRAFTVSLVVRGA